MAQASLKQVNRLLELIVESGWTREELQRRIIERWGILRDIAVALDDPQLSEDRLRAMHPLFYRNRIRTFAELLSACHQNWGRPDFNETNFPLEPTAPDEDEWEVVEYNFKKVVMGEAALVELEKMGYRFCGVRRAMEFIAANPNLQMNRSLIVTVRWQRRGDDYWLMPIFHRHGDGHGLDLIRFDIGFSPSYSWLVLCRKVHYGENAK